MGSGEQLEDDKHHLRQLVDGCINTLSGYLELMGDLYGVEHRREMERLLRAFRAVDPVPDRDTVQALMERLEKLASETNESFR